MKIKTADLTGPALDWAVAQCESVEVEYINDGITRCLLRYHHSPVYRPSVDWAIGGPLIEQREIELHKGDLDSWCAKDTNYQFLNTPQQRLVFAQGYGPTPLIAAMRCLVASRLGNEVDIPEDLLK